MPPSAESLSKRNQFKMEFESLGIGVFRWEVPSILETISETDLPTFTLANLTEGMQAVLFIPENWVSANEGCANAVFANLNEFQIVQPYTGLEGGSPQNIWREDCLVVRRDLLEKMGGIPWQDIVTGFNGLRKFLFKEHRTVVNKAAYHGFTDFRPAIGTERRKLAAPTATILKGKMLKLWEVPQSATYEEKLFYALENSFCSILDTKMNSEGEPILTEIGSRLKLNLPQKKSLPLPQMTFTEIKNQEIVAFTQKLMRTRSVNDLVPLSIERAEALASNPSARADDTVLCLTRWGEKYIAYMEILSGSMAINQSLLPVSFISTLFMFNECEILGNRADLLKHLSRFRTPIFLLDESPHGSAFVQNSALFETLAVKPIYRIAKCELQKCEADKVTLLPLDGTFRKDVAPLNFEFYRDEREIAWRLNSNWKNESKPASPYFFENLICAPEQLGYSVAQKENTIIGWVTFFLFEETKSGTKILRLLDHTLAQADLTGVFHALSKFKDFDCIETMEKPEGWSGKPKRYRTYFYLPGNNRKSNFSESKLHCQMADGQFGFTL